MYDLHELGWHSFQQLCLTITREILGQTVESFLDSADAGKDGAFTGVWRPTNEEALQGRFVIQCKFTGKRGKTLTLSELVDDAEKARKLAKAVRCDCYLLMTNAGISGTLAEDIETLLKSKGVKQVRTFGSTWICQQIKENKRLRMLVPRMYGLGDLTQILDERAYNQAKALLASLREDMSKVVLTQAYRRAADSLDKHGFVMLIGEPAAGKTTIASMLSMAALDQWGAFTLKLDNPATVLKHWNPDEPSQFFWIDDAFGVTQYESLLVQGWNHSISQIRAMLQKGAKIVMTSRDYIYNRARNDLKEGAFPLFREGQVVIDVHDLTSEEKQQILYNHLKLGSQNVTFRTDIKPFLPTIAGHQRFVPETARRLAEPHFTKALRLHSDDVVDFVEKQEHFLQEVLRGLDSHCKAALALVYMRSGSLESPVDLSDPERDVLERIGSHLGSCLAALESMKNSFVQYAYEEGRAIWRFKHPTVGDAFADLLRANPEWLGIYVRGTPIDRLLGQITCGDAGLENAVVIPKALFPSMLSRLDQPAAAAEFKTPAFAAWKMSDRIHSFLAWRCSKDFVAEYLQRHPETLDRVAKPGLYLNSVSEVNLAITLHAFGLLPEEHRVAFISTVVEYAIDGLDFFGLESARVQGVFTEKELATFRERARNELMPKLSDVRIDWQDNCGDQKADEFMEPFLDSLESLKREFAGDSHVINTIESEIDLARDWIADRQSESPERVRPPRRFGDVATPDLVASESRSIFDDIDE